MQQRVEPENNIPGSRPNIPCGQDAALAVLRCRMASPNSLHSVRWRHGPWLARGPLARISVTPKPAASQCWMGG